ncbi:MAG TPA: hypothetical protein VEB59_07670 [Gemmatimonadales bacterium]|nr:hypothetical protein [Gemmatimonadales bacterium]
MRLLVVLSGALLAGSAAAQTPGPRNAHGAAFDSRNNAMIVVAGAGTDAVLDDTWSWKDGRWSLLAASGPGRRTFPAVAFDSARGEVVLFGGNRVLFGDSTHPPAMLGDTWLLHGREWRRVRGGGPPPRAEAAIAYDPRRERIVLFGGYARSGDSVVRLGDTWEWDGRRWRLASRTGPPPRSGAAMAYAPRLGAVVLFGGSGGPLGDTWTWNGRAWTRLRAADPPGRFNAVMAADPVTGRLVRFGGWNGSRRVSETWELGEAGWTLVDTVGPPARNHATLVAAPRLAALVLFGGHDGDRVFGDVWERRGGRWTPRETPRPVRRVENGH